MLLYILLILLLMNTCVFLQRQDVVAGRFLRHRQHYHVWNGEEARREDDGVRRRRHGQHEGEGTRDGRRDHQVQWVELDGDRLKWDEHRHGYSRHFY